MASQRRAEHILKLFPIRLQRKGISFDVKTRSAVGVSRPTDLWRGQSVHMLCGFVYVEMWIRVFLPPSLQPS